jgi:hypothetical protein
MVASSSGGTTKRRESDQSGISFLSPSVIECGSTLFMMKTLSNDVTRSNSSAR